MTNDRRPARLVRSAWNWTSEPVQASRMVWILARPAAGRAWSISPAAERRTSRTPVTTMLPATAIAINGSSVSQPLNHTQGFKACV